MEVVNRVQSLQSLLTSVLVYQTKQNLREAFSMVSFLFIILRYMPVWFPPNVLNRA